MKIFITINFIDFCFGDEYEVNEIPFGARLINGRNNIKYKSLGNFQLRTFPKPKLKPIAVPVQRIRHEVRYVPVHVERKPFEPNVFQVDTTNGEERPPLVFSFKSISSDVQLSHSHKAEDVPPVQETKSQDEPQYSLQEVNKPVIQEVYEYITPYRYFIREIRPVIEIQNSLIPQRLIPVDINDYSNTYKQEGLNCFNFNNYGIYDRNLYNGQSPYDYKYNSTRGLVSYMNSDNLLFNILRKYRD